MLSLPLHYQGPVTVYGTDFDSIKEVSYGDPAKQIPFVVAANDDPKLPWKLTFTIGKDFTENAGIIVPQIILKDGKVLQKEQPKADDLILQFNITNQQ